MYSYDFEIEYNVQIFKCTNVLCSDRVYSTSFLCAIITCKHWPFSEYFQILYIFSQIFKYFAVFQYFFAFFLKYCTHALTFQNSPYLIQITNFLILSVISSAYHETWFGENKGKY